MLLFVAALWLYGYLSKRQSPEQPAVSSPTPYPTIAARPTPTTPLSPTPMPTQTPAPEPTATADLRQVARRTPKPPPRGVLPRIIEAPHLVPVAVRPRTAGKMNNCLIRINYNAATNKVMVAGPCLWDNPFQVKIGTGAFTTPRPSGNAFELDTELLEKETPVTFKLHGDPAIYPCLQGIGGKTCNATCYLKSQ